jgi:hypothetical protein
MGVAVFFGLTAEEVPLVAVLRLTAFFAGATDSSVSKRGGCADSVIRNVIGCLWAVLVKGSGLRRGGSGEVGRRTRGRDAGENFAEVPWGCFLGFKTLVVLLAFCCFAQRWGMILECFAWIGLCCPPPDERNTGVGLRGHSPCFDSEDLNRTKWRKWGGCRGICRLSRGRTPSIQCIVL